MSAESLVRNKVNQDIIYLHATSTNGTPKMAALNSSGCWFILAPTSRPPALRPSQESFCGVVIPFPIELVESAALVLLPTSHSAISTKSLKVFFFV